MLAFISGAVQSHSWIVPGCPESLAALHLLLCWTFLFLIQGLLSDPRQGVGFGRVVSCSFYRFFFSLPP